MNHIFWGPQEIGIISNEIASESHSHLVMQLFLGLEDDVEISIHNRKIVAPCIVVNPNIYHEIYMNDKLHFTLLISPTACYKEQFCLHMNEFGYCVFADEHLDIIRKQGQILSRQCTKQNYRALMMTLHTYFKISCRKVTYDPKIVAFLNFLNSCDCYDHTIATFADNIGISASRLSHLFKEEVGVSIKSYLIFHQMQVAFEAALRGETMTDAALNAGFNSPSHFASTTKKMLGMSATQSLKNSVFLKVD